jgi:hypothetical protein
MWPDTLQQLLSFGCKVCALGALVCAALLGEAHAQAPSQELALPPICDIQTTPNGTISPSTPNEPKDCFEFGAAVGELSWGWRQKLPSQVRWLQRQDAANMCLQNQSELGQKVGPAVAGGCIFLSANACTVITPAYLPPALLSNAIRHCVP